MKRSEQSQIMLQLAKKVRWLEVNGLFFEEAGETDDLIDRIIDGIYEEDE